MADESLSGPGPHYILIQDVSDNGENQEGIEMELEQALESKTSVIIIEPVKLGNETARWINVGNFLHKMSVVSGVSSIIITFKWQDSGFLYYPLGFFSILCSGVYAISWQYDPCCKYQVEKDLRNLDKYNIPLYKLTSTDPVVLVRRDDSRRKILQNLISLAAFSVCGWKFYSWFQQ